MVPSKRKTAYVVGCDLSPETGEGFLALSLIELMRSCFDVTIYTDRFTQILSSFDLFRDRVLPFYLFIVCLTLRLFGYRVVLLNYVPIWNFLNALLAFCGVRLAPITGSVLITPARASFWERIKRLYLQRALIKIFELLLPRRTFFWCATPSVFLRLQNAGLRNLCFGFPYLNKIEPAPKMTKTFDLFIYSNSHPVKNHKAVIKFLSSQSSLGLKICYVGPPLKTHPNVTSFSGVLEKDFNHLLACSRLYLTFSFEDAGITGFKALAYGIPVLCPRSSGLAFAVQYDVSNCFIDPYNIDDVLSKSIFLLSPEAVNQNSLMIQKFNKQKENYNEAASKWVTSL